jgi:hypothetical protein
VVAEAGLGAWSGRRRGANTKCVGGKARPRSILARMGVGKLETSTACKDCLRYKSWGRGDGCALPIKPRGSGTAACASRVRAAGDGEERNKGRLSQTHVPCRTPRGCRGGEQGKPSCFGGSRRAKPPTCASKNGAWEGAPQRAADAKGRRARRVPPVGFRLYELRGHSMGEKARGRRNLYITDEKSRHQHLCGCWPVRCQA